MVRDGSVDATPMRQKLSSILPSHRILTPAHQSQHRPTLKHQASGTLNITIFVSGMTGQGIEPSAPALEADGPTPSPQGHRSGVASCTDCTVFIIYTVQPEILKPRSLVQRSHQKRRYNKQTGPWSGAWVHTHSKYKPLPLPAERGIKLTTLTHAALLTSDFRGQQGAESWPSTFVSVVHTHTPHTVSQSSTWCMYTQHTYVSQSSVYPLTVTASHPGAVTACVDVHGYCSIR